MSSGRITMQDIANACGLSRNTVSKVFNGRGTVPQTTRELVLRTAKEIGYGSPVNESSAVSGSAGSIALLTRFFPGENHFGSTFLTSFTDWISRSGYSMKIYEISAEELRDKRLPPHFIPDQIAGILGIEIFDPDYLNMICTLGIPTVLTDSPADGIGSLMACDYVTMENMAGVSAIVRQLAASGARRFGFVGDKNHCGSFRERWMGFQLGLRVSGLSLDKSLCICEPDESPYTSAEWLLSKMNEMPSIPDAFVCANDHLAIHVMLALKRQGYNIPQDVMVTGFDGAAQSAFTDPPLTTVHIPGAEIGQIAARVLLKRIRENTFPYGWIRVRTTPVWRGSTR